MKKSNDDRIAVRLETGTKKRVIQESRKQGITLSEYLRRAVETSLHTERQSN